MLRMSITLVLIVSTGFVAAIAGIPPKVITAVRTDSPPVLDGILNEPQWEKAPPILDFTQFDPAEGALPTEITSVRILYDDRALYVGVTCYDAHPEKIVRQLTRRDRTSEADRFSVMIDSYHDRQTAFVFVTNVSGVQSDGVLSQDGSVYDIGWDAVWGVKTRIYRDGWSAEFEIPYNALRFAQSDTGCCTWGINFRRYISRKKETDEWVMVPRTEVVSISRWGTVEGIRDIVPPLHLELMPYVSAKVVSPAADPARPWKAEEKSQVGLDVKFGIARNFTIDATVNPDFGQVEVDQSILNLTVFETHYPEKRPFFLEGAQLFTFGSSVDNTPLSLFFSRRIGKQPTGSAPPDWSFENSPQITTIQEAVKFSGRSSTGLSVGAISASTDEMSAEIDSAGRKASMVTEPRGSYNVVRVKQEFEGGSWLGGIGTVTSRRGLAPGLSGGLDWNLRLGEGSYTLDGYTAWAQSSGYRLLSDGTLAKSRDGAAGRLLFANISAEHWFYTGSADFFMRDFDPNDAGYFAQPHDYGGYGQILYRENSAEGIFHRYGISLAGQPRWDWEKTRTKSLVELNAYGELTNFWSPSIIYDLSFPAYDDAEVGIVGTYKRPLSHSILAQIITDPRTMLVATATANYVFDAKGKRSLNASLGVTVRPASWIELVPTVLWVRTRKEEAWIPGANVIDPAVGPSMFSVFANRSVDEVDLDLSGTVTFTRTFSFQFFSQLLVARAHYTEERRFVDGRAIAYTATGVNGDFNEAILHGNMLLRWEYLPGSTIYLVWTQERYDALSTYAPGVGARFRESFSLPHEDVLVLKISYWFPF